ncbi:type II secretion system minor pseudopilin GspI [Neisseriaceae bacterium TC5R-5]|nr:type II secretion system minor pseudopilin GspI [Neisseriaceae bacterium TC5R-5]
MMAREQGFTLVEVLVALAIIAVALGALLRATGLAADNSSAMKRRMQAGWEAQNIIAMMQARQEWPELGATTGESKDEGEVWKWQRVTSQTPNANFRKVVIKVLAAEQPGYVLAEMTAYLRNNAGGAQ